LALSPTSSHGGGAFLTTTTQISAAQILALNTTAIQLLPAVTGALVFPTSVTWLFSPIGTTAYTVPGQLFIDVGDLFTSGGGTFLLSPGLGALLQTSPAVLQVAYDDFANLQSALTSANPGLLASMVNQPVMLRLDTGNPTLGDSGLEAVIVYQVVTP
jgi:hypothetical protein